MFFKKKNRTKTDTNYVKQDIINWAARQNVEIKMMEIQLGDFRDGADLSNRISVFVFFKTNVELEKYENDGFISKLRAEIAHLLKDAIWGQEQIDFIFDSHENVVLNYNGNYLHYSVKKPKGETD